MFEEFEDNNDDDFMLNEDEHLEGFDDFKLLGSESIKMQKTLKISKNSKKSIEFDNLPSLDLQLDLHKSKKFRQG